MFSFGLDDFNNLILYGSDRASCIFFPRTTFICTCRPKLVCGCFWEVIYFLFGICYQFGIQFWILILYFFNSLLKIVHVFSFDSQFSPQVANNFVFLSVNKCRFWCSFLMYQTFQTYRVSVELLEQITECRSELAVFFRYYSYSFVPYKKR